MPRSAAQNLHHDTAALQCWRWWRCQNPGCNVPLYCVHAGMAHELKCIDPMISWDQISGAGALTRAAMSHTTSAFSIVQPPSSCTQVISALRLSSLAFRQPLMRSRRPESSVSSAQHDIPRQGVAWRRAALHPGNELGLLLRSAHLSTAIWAKLRHCPRQDLCQMSPGIKQVLNRHQPRCLLFRSSQNTRQSRASHHHPHQVCQSRPRSAHP